ncbi:hypothetical protein QE152_g37708 [Popillia japonica]|uniref:Uncharacterized protein n=1 Tax=Popillia japonica TaxID=7064 RepID=A0AAW1I9D7_POPJA
MNMQAQINDVLKTSCGNGSRRPSIYQFRRMFSKLLAEMVAEGLPFTNSEVIFFALNPENQRRSSTILWFFKFSNHLKLIHEIKFSNHLKLIHEITSGVNLDDELADNEYAGPKLLVNHLWSVDETTSGVNLGD